MADSNIPAPPRLGKTGPKPKPEIERFMRYVRKDGECWIWTGHTMTAGYGNFGIGSRTDKSKRKIGAHIWAFQHFRGPVPERWHLDHGDHCRNKLCVNPDHMTPISPEDHARTPDSGAGLRMAVTHCPRGHEYLPWTTRVKANGWRSCKICGRDQERERRHGLQIKG